ncbi:MAG: hypothetical protein ACK5L0_09635 [Candidatus Fimivivens sp.]
MGNSSTTPRDLPNDSDVKLMIYILSDSVAARTWDHSLLERVVSISVRDSKLRSFTRQCTLTHAACLTDEISHAAFSLFQRTTTGRHPLVPSVSTYLSFHTKMSVSG